MYPTLSVAESLALFAGYFERPRDVDEVVRLIGLEEKRDSHVRTLSGGQRRRLDLGLALVGDPDLLFLDEPTTGFDPQARRRAWESISSLRALGKTILLTTHYLDEAEHLCDRVGVLRGGRFAAIGRPGELTGALPPSEVRYWEDGHEVVLRTEEPTRVLHELTAKALAEGRELEGLEVRRPSLEEVYLSLTEEELRVNLFFHELSYQLRLYSRSRELAFFTFLLPMVLYLLLGFAYGDQEIQGVKGSDYLMTGTLGYGVIATAFAGLSIVLVLRREEGILKRLRATPLPAPAYLIAVLTTTLLAFLVQGVCIVAVGMLAFGASFPSHLFSLVLSMLLGAASFAALGVGLTGLVRRSEGASAIVNAIYLPMLFLSGVVLREHELPAVPAGGRGRAPAHVLHPARLQRRLEGRPDLGSPRGRRRARGLGPSRGVRRRSPLQVDAERGLASLEAGTRKDYGVSRAGDRFRDEDLRTACTRNSGQFRRVRRARGDAG